MSDIYEAQKEIHAPYLCNYALPDVNYFYKNFSQWLQYDKGTTFCNEKSKLRRFYHKANILGYLGPKNPLNRFENSVKGHIFLPGASIHQLKSMELYCENLAKVVRKEMKRASTNLLDIQIFPTTTGFYFTIFSKLPKLCLATLDDFFKGMTLLASTSYKSAINLDNLKINYKKMDVVDVAYQQLLACLNLQVEDWEAGMATNFMNVNETAKKTLFSKTVLLFFGDFNVEDCKKKAEYMGSNFCYQRTDFCFPSLTSCSMIPAGKPSILEHYFEGNPKNSAMICFYQTKIDDFFDYYNIKENSSARKSSLSQYQVAKMFTMLAHHVLQVEFFQSLRSEHCLGYHVYSRLVCQDGLLGVAYFIQSSENCPITLAQHTMRFVKENASKINLSDEDVKLGFQAALKKPLDRVYEKHQFMYRLQEIFFCNEAFDEFIKIPNLTNNDLIASADDFHQFLSAFYLKKASNLQVHVIGSDHRSSQEGKRPEFIKGLQKSTLFRKAAAVRAQLGTSPSPSSRLFDDWFNQFNALGY